MKSVICVLMVLVAAVAGIQSHGPAHRETNVHAQRSQDMTHNLWHMQNQQRDKVMGDLAKFVEDGPASVDDMVKKMSRKESLAMKRNLHEMYHPSPAISLLEKTSFSKPLERRDASVKTRDIDWKKWEKFVLNEFEAARMTGELDAQAHSDPIPESSTTENLLETGEGMDTDASQVDKMCGCKMDLVPVCGSDGETYPSKCFAECASLSISHEGPCLSKQEVEKTGSFRIMSRSDNGVGDQTLLAVSTIPQSDDDMFSSAMEQAKSREQAGVDYASLPRADAQSEAREAKGEELRKISRDIVMPFVRPVTERQFRDNLNELSRVATQFEGAMRSEKLAKCECRGSYSPVCGTDHETYPSPCYASCVGMALKHAGPCYDDEVALGPSTSASGSVTKDEVPDSVDDVRDPLCFCSLKEKSVCGTDGITYTNRCFADCAHVRVRSEGPCYQVKA